MDTQIDPKLLPEWQQFDSITSNMEGPKGANTPKITDGQDTTSTKVSNEGTNGLPRSTDLEMIPKDPSDQIIL